MGMIERGLLHKLLKGQGSPCIGGNGSCIILHLAYAIPADGRATASVGWKEGVGYVCRPFRVPENHRSY